MPQMLFDPPELAEYAERVDPPIAAWPGTIRTKHDVMKACGDKRDWFRFGHRYEAYLRYWNEWADARNRRRDMSVGFAWDQIMIIGEYGAGKTTLGVKAALADFRRGHCVFSNAGCLIGWRLEYEEMYTALGLMPKHSSLLIDESSAALSSKMGGGVAVSSFAEMNLNSRKQNARVYYMSAQDYEIAPAIRRETREVWMPVPKDKLTIVADYYGMKHLAPANDPDNFRIAYFVWTGYPYKKGNIIEGQDKTMAGFGPPDEVRYDEGDQVRDAFLLTDTFELAMAGAARTASSDNVKAQLRSFLGKEDPRDVVAAQLVDWVRQLSDMDEESVPEYVTASQIAEDLDVSEQKIGSEMRKCYPGVQRVPYKGYRTTDLVDADVLREKGFVGPAARRALVESRPSAPSVAAYVNEIRERSDRPEYVKAEEIARVIGMDQREVGKAVTALGVKAKQRYGYPLAALIEAVDRADDGG